MTRRFVFGLFFVSVFLFFRPVVIFAQPAPAFPQAQPAPYVETSALPHVPQTGAFDLDDSFAMDQPSPAREEEMDFSAPPSPLEKIYSTRAGEPLLQFGYDLFMAQDSISENPPPLGAVQDDFIIGSGDSLQITFSGQRTDQKIYTVTPEGTILIPDLPPVAAAGRSIGDLRATLEALVSKLHNTQIYISLANVGKISVLVIGHVKNPGLKTLTSFDTIMDALIKSGGIEKTGSLRTIKLVRSGTTQTIDLYTLLQNTITLHDTGRSDLRLRDGDRLIIPPIGKTFAVSGSVKRSGIFEIPESSAQNDTGLFINDALEIAGGMLSAGYNRLMILEPQDNGQEIARQIQDTARTALRDGLVLMVENGDGKRSGTVVLKGNSRRNGMHDFSRNNTLSKLLHGQDILGDDTYPLIGVIKRWNTDQMATSFIAFPLRLVLKGTFDQNLADGDEIYLFSNQDIEALQEEKSRFSETTEQETGNASLLHAFLRENAVFVRGAVRKPGLYPVADGATLDTLLSVAGGMGMDANTQNIEITSFQGGENGQAQGRNGTQRTYINLAETLPSSVPVHVGDSVRINHTTRKNEEKTVQIAGEILSPGKYDLVAGDRLSDLLTRAGGLTEHAYPEGAIFSRESERRTEEARYRAQAKDMERALAASLQQEKDRPDANQIALVRELAQTLSTIESVGRITVEADPAILQTQPELDVLLESGDRIYIPKRPSSVRVTGEILSPAALQFRQERTPRDYIEQAGGFTFHADKDRVFVLFPDGSAQPLQVNTWNHKPVFIPPGSTIVVPRDPKPFDFIQSAKDISQILSNLAVTTIFVDDIRD